MQSTENVRVELMRVLALRAATIALDPRVPATLRIGGIGHRRIEPEKLPRLVATLENLFRQIRSSFESTAGAGDAATRLFAITPLAEGSDRIIAEAAMGEGFGLGAVLPFPTEHYESTFDLGPDRETVVGAFRALLAKALLPRGYGVLVLDGSHAANERVTSYRHAAEMVIRWSDILIAVMSPDRSDSETGVGVQAAIKRGTPVILLDPAEPETFLLAVDGEVLTQEHSTVARLNACVRQLVMVSESDEEKRQIASYRNENIRCDLERVCDFERLGPYAIATAAPWWLSWFAGVNQVVARLMKVVFLRRRLRDHDAFNGGAFDLPFEPGTTGPFVELFLRFHRADTAATAYGELHRSGQIVTAALGVLTAAFAVSKLVMANSPVLPMLELACLVYAATIVVVAHRQRWLARWLDYRLLAEILRYAKYLMLSGHSAALVDIAHVEGMRKTWRRWTHDYARAALHAIRIAMPGRAANPNPQALERVVAYLCEQCIDGQILYHHQTVELRGAINRLLRKLAIGVVALTAFSMVAKLIIEMSPLDAALSEPPWLAVKQFLSGLSILLPALAGGLLALRAYGEYSVVARRSHVLESTLKREKQHLKSAKSIFELQQQMAPIAAELLRDVDGWLDLFSEKHIEL